MAARQALEVDPSSSDAFALLGQVAFAADRLDEAERLQRQALAADRKAPQYLCGLGLTLAARGKYRDALRCFESALKLDPGNELATAGTAEVHERRGNVERVRKLVNPLVAKNAATTRMRAVLVSAEYQAGRDERVIELAAPALEGDDPDGMAQRQVAFTLARALERQERFDDAMVAAKRGNAILRPGHDRSAVIAAHDRIRSVFSDAAWPALPRSTNTSRKPIFIVGLPRSGSTLVEQILHAHPSVHGAGEIRDLGTALRETLGPAGITAPIPECAAALDQAALDAIAERYLELTTARAPKTERIVDKSLGKFAWSGLLHQLFPEATIIHTQRDPSDLAISCYLQHLAPLQHPWTCDLDDIAHMIGAHDALMAHWRDTLAVPLVEVKYEDLVANLESETRRLLEACGLPWDDRCLAFHEAERDVLTLSYDQVRQSLYTSSVGRGARFGVRIEPTKIG